MDGIGVPEQQGLLFRCGKGADKYMLAVIFSRDLFYFQIERDRPGLLLHPADDLLAALNVI